METGLYYYRARYYDAGLGRFISRDPIGYDADDLNLYRYVMNNPIHYSDPTGMQPGAGSISQEQLDYATSQCMVPCGLDNPSIVFNIMCDTWFPFFNSHTKQDLIDKMYDIQTDANNFATAAIAELGVRNTERNHSALRHCYASAMFAQLLGTGCAGCLGNAREDYQEKYQNPPQTPDVTARTKRYNAIGLLCGISPNVKSCCKNMLDKMTQ